MRVYSVVMENQTVVADATLIIVHAEATYGSAGSLLELVRATVSQSGTSTSQQLGVILGRKVTAFGTYTATTPTPHMIGGIASGITGATTGAESTAGTDASAEGAGAVTAIDNQGFNNLSGYLWVPTPEERVFVGPDQAVVVKLRGTPTTLTGWHATLTYIEHI
jgi:hypothetical protein